MLLKAKRAQVSIEILILVFAVLFGGVILSSQMIKDSGDYGEVKETKKITFEAFSGYLNSSNVSYVSGETPEEDEETPEEDEETFTETIAFGLKINPGNGNPVEFNITCDNSAEYTYYDLDNGIGLRGYSNISENNGLLIQKGTADTYTAQATYIRVKATGGVGSRNIIVNGVPHTVQAFTLESKNPENPITFAISHDGGGSGQFYLTVYADSGSVIFTDYGSNFN